MAKAAALKKTMGMPLVMGQESGRDWHLWHGDCVEVSKGIPDNSIHYSWHSPPFISLYTFSDDPRDVSNNKSAEEFWEHYRFLIRELYRATIPGRLASIHSMILPASKAHDGYIGLKDFRGDILRMFQAEGWIFHSEVVIWKDPVVAMQRTKSIGLLHKQVVKDSAMSRQGVPDYITTMRKPGENSEPITGRFTSYYRDGAKPADPLLFENSHGRETLVSEDEWYSVAVWQRMASPVWFDIDQGDVLTHKVAREVADERHISAAQLTPIRRCIDLWSNPGDVVFDPFTGIGSTQYCAIEMGRRGLGVELKESYFRQAVANMREIDAKLAEVQLFP